MDCGKIIIGVWLFSTARVGRQVFSGRYPVPDRVVANGLLRGSLRTIELINKVLLILERPMDVFKDFGSILAISLL
jgi:hypothetical protein